MATAGIYDITIDQGATWNLEVQWQDSTGTGVNMTGYDVRAQIRTNYASKGGTELVNLALDPLLLPNTTGISWSDATKGSFWLTISSTDTGELPAGLLVWDLEAESAGGEVTRLLMGSVTVRAEVTR